MPGAKLPILTITNKEYFRDDGLYIYSSTDGQLDIIADTTAKVTAPTTELEATTITLDGNITIDGSHTFTGGTGTVTFSGATALNNNVTLAGDLIRRSQKFISGAGVSGYTPLTDNAELPDEGVLLLSGRSGNLTPKLTATPTIGKMIDIVYIDSGNADGYTAIISGNFKWEDTTYTQVTLSNAGDAVTVTGNNRIWYLVTPSSATRGYTLS